MEPVQRGSSVMCCRVEALRSAVLTTFRSEMEAEDDEGIDDDDSVIYDVNSELCPRYMDLIQSVAKQPW